MMNAVCQDINKYKFNWTAINPTLTPIGDKSIKYALNVIAPLSVGVRIINKSPNRSQESYSHLIICLSISASLALHLIPYDLLRWRLLHFVVMGLLSLFSRWIRQGYPQRVHCIEGRTIRGWLLSPRRHHPLAPIRSTTVKVNSSCII